MWKQLLTVEELSSAWTRWSSSRTLERFGQYMCNRYWEDSSQESDGREGRSDLFHMTDHSKAFTTILDEVQLGSTIMEEVTSEVKTI